MTERPVTAGADCRHVNIREFAEFHEAPPVMVRDGASPTMLAALALARVERLTMTAQLFESGPEGIDIDQVATLFTAPLQEVGQLIMAILMDPSLKPPPLEARESGD